jgi:HEAT repeat protein
MLRWIEREPKPSKIKRFVSILLSKLPLGQNFISVQRWLVSRNPWDRHADLAMAAFGILGPAAFPAVPGLARIATRSTDSEPAHRAVDALVKIGPLALPALISVSTNRNARARFYAMRSISILGTNAAPVVPIIILYLTDKAVAGAAFETLGRLKLEPQLVVPSLMARAHDPDAVLRSWAIITLGDFGQEARRAAPELLSALSDNEAAVRESATNALQIIAPELLKQTPPR